MSSPVMCPICGTHNFMSLAVEDNIHPSVKGHTNQGVKILPFSCEMGHVFMTLDETEQSIDSVVNASLYERHRLN